MPGCPGKLSAIQSMAPARWKNSGAESLNRLCRNAHVACHVNMGNSWLIKVLGTVGRCTQGPVVSQSTYCKARPSCSKYPSTYEGTAHECRQASAPIRSRYPPSCMLAVATGVLQRAARGSKLPEFWKSTLVPVLVVVQSCWNSILQGFNDRPPSNRQCITHFPHRPLSPTRSGHLSQQRDTPSSCLDLLLFPSSRLPACPCPAL